MNRFLFVLVALLLPAAQASAHDYHIGSLQIGHPWATATPKGAKVGGGYLKITNTGGAPDRLISVASPAAGQLVIHSQTTENGVAKMRPVEGGLEIKPGETIELKPGGLHVMFEGLKAPLVQGRSVKGTLVFEKAGNIDVDFAIEAIGTQSPPADHGH